MNRSKGIIWLLAAVLLVGCTAGPTAPVDIEPDSTVPEYVGVWTTDGPSVVRVGEVEILVQMGVQIFETRACRFEGTFGSVDPNASAVRFASASCYATIRDNGTLTLVGVAEYTVYPEPGVPPHTEAQRFTTPFFVSEDWSMLVEASTGVWLLRREGG